MIRIVVASVGKPRTPGLSEAIAEYETRVSRYFRFEPIEIAAASLPDERADEARREEGEALLRRLPEGLERVALTRVGSRWSTRDLAHRLAEAQTYGLPGLAFAIGGAHGLDDPVLEAADRRVSLSNLTLPHELARLVLAEQVYRAGTILRGEPYHKGP
jgi:23S rRNA (pseudouridine1915-N3)-methyltransferase